MKKIVCEVCGSSDFIKMKGEFKCRECGMSYELEEIKKMMVESDEVNTLALHDTPEALDVDHRYELLNKLMIIREYIVRIKEKKVSLNHLFIADSKRTDFLEYSPEEIKKLNTYRKEEFTYDEFKENFDNLYTQNLFHPEGIEEDFNMVRYSKEEEKWEIWNEKGLEILNLADADSYFFTLTFGLRDTTYSDDYTISFTEDDKNNIMKKMYRKIVDALIRYNNNGVVRVLDKPYFNQVKSYFEKYFTYLNVDVKMYKEKKTFVGNKSTLIRENKVVNFLNKVFSYMTKYDSKQLYMDELYTKTNERIHKYSEEIEPLRDSLVSISESMQMVKNEFRLIPEKNRNEKDILILMNAIYSERANTIGEALNLLDTYEFRGQVLDNFNELHEKINVLGQLAVRMNQTIEANFKRVENSLDIIETFTILNFFLN